MKQTAAQHQKQLDDSAVIESLQEAIEAEMREELLAGRYIEIEYMLGQSLERPVYDRMNVVEAMIALDSDEFDGAIFMTTRDPAAAAKTLSDMWPEGVERVIEKAKTREAAEYMMEDDRSEAA